MGMAVQKKQYCVSDIYPRRQFFVWNLLFLEEMDFFFRKMYLCGKVIYFWNDAYRRKDINSEYF